MLVAGRTSRELSFCKNPTQRFHKMAAEQGPGGHPLSRSERTIYLPRIVLIQSSPDPTVHQTSKPDKMIDEDGRQVRNEDVVFILLSSWF